MRDESVGIKFKLGFYFSLLAGSHSSGYAVYYYRQYNDCKTSLSAAADLDAVDSQYNFKAQPTGAYH